MLNNDIDHSEAQVVSLQIQLTRENIELLVSDDGIGIFNKIQTACHLENPEQAIFELSKGKLTTDPSRHSGEGIFFTSRIFDRFSILSGGLWFGHTREKTDWLMNDFKDRRPGTAVFMYIALNSEHTVQEAFDAYSTTQDGMTFDKTVVALDLAKSGPLVSRSQAKRVVSRLDRFREAVLDFQDVSEIGQAFADEIFRVYRSNNPGVELTHIHANEAVEKMIHRVTTAEARAAVQGSAVGAILRRLLAREDFIGLSEDDKWTQLRSAIAAADASELPVVDSVEPSVRQMVMHFLIEMAKEPVESPD
jgi:anti-sigma regulatory factor (Ser/Thr protein kinase)